MKITAIRTNTKKKAHLQPIIGFLNYKLKRAGFDVNVFAVNSSRIDVSGFQRGRGPQRLEATFTLSTSVKKGYRRGKKPTWNHYVELNDAVNDVLDALKISASIRSMEFVVRDRKTGRINSWDKPGWVLHNERLGYGPTFETEAEAAFASLKFRKVG